jgi:hypothetical protein
MTEYVFILTAAALERRAALAEKRDAATMLLASEL